MVMYFYWGQGMQSDWKAIQLFADTLEDTQSS